MSEPMSRWEKVARALESGAADPMWANHCEMGRGTCAAAAQIIRSQHELILELRVALEGLHGACVADGWGVYGAHSYTRGLARSALAKAEEQS